MVYWGLVIDAFQWKNRVIFFDSVAQQNYTVHLSPQIDRQDKSETEPVEPGLWRMSGLCLDWNHLPGESQCVCVCASFKWTDGQKLKHADLDAMFVRWQVHGFLLARSELEARVHCSLWTSLQRQAWQLLSLRCTLGQRCANGSPLPTVNTYTIHRHRKHALQTTRRIWQKINYSCAWKP